MKFDITVRFTVDDLDTKRDAREFGQSLAEHVLHTFNDNETISPYVDIIVVKS